MKNNNYSISSNLFLDNTDLDVVHKDIDKSYTGIHECWLRTRQELMAFYNVLPEFNYFTFSLINIFLKDLLQALSKLGILLSSFEKTLTLILKSPLIPIVWNLLDAICSIYIGLHHLFDKITHRQAATQIKGALNIISGVQLIVLTLLNPTLLATPSFALAFFFSFIISLDDSIYTIRRVLSIKYWLNDSLAELEHLNKKLIPPLEEDKNKSHEVEMYEFGNMAKKNTENKTFLEERLERHKVRKKVTTQLFKN